MDNISSPSKATTASSRDTRGEATDPLILALRLRR